MKGNFLVLNGKLKIKIRFRVFLKCGKVPLLVRY